MRLPRALVVLAFAHGLSGCIYGRLGLLALAGLTLGCEQQAPSGPTELLPTPLRLISITPSTGSTLSPVLVTIRGAGFLQGATVTLDAVAAGVTVVDGTTLTALAPPHDEATVDLVVTNPTGQSARLPGAFRFSFNPTRSHPARARSSPVPS